MSCLRAKSAADLQNSSAGFRGGILSGPLPTAGVPELPLPPAEAVRTGRFERVPLLIGSTHDEVWGWARSFATATPAQYEKSLEYLFGNRAQLAQQVAKYQPKTFLYRFDARSPSAPPAPGAFDVGASHAADQAYLWPTATSVYDRDKLRLSAEMVRYWGAFVRQGTPDAAGQAGGPSVPDKRAVVLQLGGISTLTSAAFAAARHCDLWNGISYQWLDLNPERLAQQVGVVRQ